MQGISSDVPVESHGMNIDSEMLLILLVLILLMNNGADMPVIAVMLYLLM